MPEGLQFNKRHVVIEGPIGVGKTSLCKKIVDTYGGHLFMEKPADNPFLERFYQSPQRYALATQLFFLFQRVQQMSDLKNQQVDQVVADFMVEKDPIFAGLTLNTEEVAIYEQVFSSLSIDKTQPSLVIYLQAPVSVLKQRVKKRNIKYEQKIDDTYLERLANAYTDYFHHYNQSPLLIVNAAEFNPIDNDDHFVELMRQIVKIQAGKHFFNPSLLSR